MDLVVPRKDLLRLVERCTRAAKASTKEGGGGSVVLEAAGNCLRVSASANEWGVSSQTLVEIVNHARASVTVRAAPLLAALGAVNDGPVHIAWAGVNDSLEIRTLGSPRRVRIDGWPPAAGEASPTPPSDALPVAIHIGALAEALAWTRRFTSTDETRPNINAVRLSTAGERLTAVSTDGHRLSVAEVPAPGTDDFGPLLVPHNAARYLCRAIGPFRWDDSAAALITLRRCETEDHRAWFTVAGTIVWCRLGSATFPDYASLIPKGHESTARIRASLISDFLHAASALGEGHEKSPLARVKIVLSTNNVRLEAHAPGATWQLSDEFPALYTGATLERTVLVDYLADTLRDWSPPSGDALLSFQPGDLGGVNVRPEAAGHGHDLLALVMPIRV